MAEEKKIITTSILPGPIELAKESWEMYKARFWTVVGIGFLGYLGIALVLFVTVVLGAIVFFTLGGKLQPNTLSVLGILGVLAIVGMTLMGTWISGSVIVSLDQWKKKIGIKESYALAKPFIFPLLLTSLLSGLIIFGSIFVFIIPAILFTVWFSLAQYSVIIDKKSGLTALQTSREYIRGRFWGVIWRMIAVHLPEIVLSMAIASGTQGRGGGELSGLFRLLSLLAIPFYQMYAYTLFMHLRKTTELKTLGVPGKSKLVYVLVPAIGYLLLIAGVVALAPLANRSMSMLPTLFNNFSSLSKQGDNIKPGTQIVTGIVLYYAAHQEYPKQLDVLVSDKILDEIPTYPISGLPYDYTLTSGGKDFRLCTPGILSPQKCVTSESNDFDL